MTLQEAMDYRGENPATLGDKIAVREMRDMVFRVLVDPLKRKQEQSNREKHRRGAGGLD